MNTYGKSIRKTYFVTIFPWTKALAQSYQNNNKGSASQTLYLLLSFYDFVLMINDIYSIISLITIFESKQLIWYYYYKFLY